MNRSVFKTVRASLLSGAAFVALSGAAYAADLGGSYKDGPAAEPAKDYSITVNGGLWTDYVFRGVSQTDNDPGVFAGADLTYKFFYIGVWAASVDEATSDGELEIDIYGGVRKSYNGVDFDFGALYYAYPNGDDTLGAGIDIDYFELKASVGTKIFNDLALTGTVFWSPDYYGEVGSTWTFEGKVAKPLPFLDLTLSGTLGHVTSDDEDFGFSGFYGDDNYTYWNVGLAKTFKEHFTVDVRYWGTDVDEDADAENFCG
ncbi:MAG: hypothetical protein HC850_09145 [Rhodomicrobium sp.]|nr:hypothetical protein [Rhodomicrobium sp.]